MRWMGFGTEKIEEDIATLFPQAGVARLDIDTARTRKDYERILKNFGERKTNILIGTQMVSKGLDFQHVTVVGILNAESLMNFPDFRANERAFQLMMQVSGRAGRREKQGLVVIQTPQPAHPLLQMLRAQNYDAMATSQLRERHTFGYPPYTRLITVVMRSKDETSLDDYADAMATLLCNSLGEASVNGPFAPSIGRVQTLFIRQLILKLKPAQTVATVRSSLEDALEKMQQRPASGNIIIHFDVDN
jgi:primosomal protein N' (replication factor Y)